MLHCDDHHQLVLPLDGTLELEVEGCAGRVTAGIGACILEDRPHAFQARGPKRFLVVDLPPLRDDALRPRFVQGIPPFFELLALSFGVAWIAGMLVLACGGRAALA